MRVHSAEQALWIAPVLVAVIVASGCTGPTEPPVAEQSPLATQPSLGRPSLVMQTTPPGNGVVAYDDSRGVVVLVTSQPTQGAQVMETWTWNGWVWTRQAPATQPPVRRGTLLAYDQSRRVTVLQGGVGMSDTWEWNGSSWSQRSPAHSPAALQESGSMAYDPATRKMLFYQMRTTWSWDGRDWTRLQPAHIPGPWQGNLVVDGKHLILNGWSPDGNRMETWGWNGINWSLLAAGHSKQLLSLPVAFDAATRKVVAYGGGQVDDTWTWDGLRWGREHPAHSPATMYVPTPLLYNRVLNRVVAFAGTGIYGWDGSDWSAVGAASPPAVAAGRELLRTTDAEAMIRRTVTSTQPVLLPRLPGGLDQALITADANGFSVRVMNDDRSIQVTMGIGGGGRGGGLPNRRVAFRGDSAASYSYVANDHTGWQELFWVERPGHWSGGSSDPAYKYPDPDGVPYRLIATGLTETELIALAGSLR